MPATHLKTRSLVELMGSADGSTRTQLTDRMRELDTDLWTHAGFVAEMAGMVSNALGLSDSERVTVIDAAWLHDLGKLTISRDILDKPQALDVEEWFEMQAHVSRGADYLASGTAFTAVVPLVRHHHERFDGRGYPDGRMAHEIPRGARIICIVDAFDAMTTDRPYRTAMSFQDALEEVSRCAGSQFDPSIVDAFLSVSDDLPRDRAG